MTKAVEVKKGHVQLFMNHSAGMLQCARLNEGSILARVHQMDRSSDRAEVATLINTNLLVSFPEILLRSLLPLIFILQQGQEDVIHGDCAKGFILGCSQLPCFCLLVILHLTLD